MFGVVYVGAFREGVGVGKVGGAVFFFLVRRLERYGVNIFISFLVFFYSYSF